MLLLYVLFLTIAIVFQLFHFPFASLIFIFSTLLLFSDILIQSSIKQDNKEIRLLSAVGAFMLSIYLGLKFLHWPISQFIYWISIIIPIIYLIRSFQKKVEFNLRFCLTSFLLIFAIFNSSLSNSSFTLLYLLEDPFDETEFVPHFSVQRIAYDLYLEGEDEKAEKLIIRNINHLNDLVEESKDNKHLNHIDRDNLAQSKMDLEDIKNHTWEKLTLLYPEDRH